MAQTLEGAEKAYATRCGISLAEFRARRAAGLKRCTRCKEWLATSSFGPDRSRGDGLTAMCVPCKRRRRTTSGPGKIERAKMQAIGKRWCRDCKDWLPSASIRQGLCPTHTRARYRDLYAANPAPFKARTLARKAGSTLPAAETAIWLMDLFDGRCAYCPRPANSWDHIKPVSRGGRSIATNFVPACRPCNASKGNRDVWDWAPGRECHESLANCLIMSEGV